MENKKPLTRRQKLNRVLKTLISLEKGDCDAIDAMVMITQTLKI
jgi:hypothetical protein